MLSAKAYIHCLNLLNRFRNEDDEMNKKNLIHVIPYRNSSSNNFFFSIFSGNEKELRENEKST